MAIKQIHLQAAFGIFVAVIYHLVKRNVRSPFIDEIFHLRQCIKYCNNDFHDWDNKITTPPGLYILGYLYGKALNIVGNADYCSNYDVLRSLNLLGGTIVMPYMLQRLKSKNGWTINIVSLPLLFTYYFLFYTDVWSTVLLVSSLAFVQEPTVANSALGGSLAFASLWFRQTNIVWVFFITVVLVERKLDIGSQFKVSDIQLFIAGCYRNWHLILPFVANGIFFIAFLVVNGGITFGDKENHEMQLHLVQVFYCLTFITVLTWPIWLSRGQLKRYLQFSYFNNYGFNLLLTTIYVLAITKIIENFTVVHPFLLADNRHYTFYIWRRILLHKNSKYLMAPIYHFATWTVADSLRSKRNNPSLGWIAVVAYFVSICVTVIPSPLFEPRYYIVPLVLFKIYCSPQMDDIVWHKDKNFYYRQVLDFVWLNGVNVLTMAVFFGYEFYWISEPANIQRIIW